MKILQVITHGGVGGAQRHVRDLSIGLSKRGYDVQVLSGSSDWLGKELGSIPLHVLPSLSRTWNPLTVLTFRRTFKKFLKSHDFDVVHFHSSNSMIGVGVVPERVKKMATVHGWSILHPGWRKSQWKKMMYKSVMSRCLNGMDEVLFVCEADSSLNRRLGATNVKTQVIHNGISADMELFSRKKARESLAIGEKEFVVGTLARKTYAKNLELFGRVQKEFEQPVRFLNLADHEEANRLLPALDVFVLTSRFEGFPYVILEAASAKVPVVSADVGGIGEFVTDGLNGFLISSKTPKDYKKAINRLRLNSELREKFVRAGMWKLKNTFSETKMLDKVEDVYASV